MHQPHGREFSELCSHTARAKEMTQLAKEIGTTRDGLYKALSPTGNPSFDTVQKVVRAFGMRLDVATLI